MLNVFYEILSEIKFDILTTFVLVIVHQTDPCTGLEFTDLCHMKPVHRSNRARAWSRDARYRCSLTLMVNLLNHLNPRSHRSIPGFSAEGFEPIYPVRFLVAVLV